jgi:methionyl-tRNA formyltransferase
VAVPALDAFLASRHEVLAVLTRPEAHAGRGQHRAPSPVAQRAASAGIEVLTPLRPRDETFIARLAELAPDCCPVVAYGGLLPSAALEIPKHGWVNLHFSLLPAWRGAAPVQHALIAGDDVVGASTFLIEESLDTGPVFGQLTETVRPGDTSGDLLARLAVAGAGLLVATIDAIEEGTAAPQPQPAEGATYAAKLTVADAHVDLTTPALHVDRLVRGCYPAPGAWVTFRGDRLKLAPVRQAPDVTDLAPGELRADKSRVLVGTGSHAVALGDVQAPGKRPMPAPDWARGVRLTGDDRLG